MILALVGLLFASTKIKDEKLSRYCILAISFVGLILNIINIFYDYHFIPHLFKSPRGVLLSITFIWFVFFAKVIYDLKEENDIAYDWPLFSLLNITVISSVPIAIGLVIVLSLLIAKQASLIDYYKAKLHFYGLYFWMILYFFHGSWPPMILGPSYILVVILFLVGSMIYLFKAYSLRSLSYLAPIFIILREDLENKELDHFIIFSLATVLFLFIWAILFTKLDKKIMETLNKYKYVEKLLLNFKIFNYMSNNHDLETIQIYKSKNNQPKTINIKRNQSVVENDIRLNALLLIVVATVIVFFFRIGIFQ